MRSWMKDQLILSHPNAQIVSEFMDRYPEFGAGLAEEVIKKRLKSRIKQMQSRGKERDEIIAGREALKAAAPSEENLPIKDQDYRDEGRQYIIDERIDIINQLKDESLTPVKRKNLTERSKMLTAMRGDIDAAERSEHRQRGGGSNVINPIILPTLHTPDPAEEKKSTPALPPPKEDKEPEPEWYEIPDPDVEHLTV